jgi:hypothetical protein
MVLGSEVIKIKKYTYDMIDLITWKLSFWNESDFNVCKF